MDGDILEMSQNFEDVADELAACTPEDLSGLTEVASQAQEALNTLLQYITDRMQTQTETETSNDPQKLGNNGNKVL
jgi:cell fate (sporulation/competence/biofilm development) regulator YmcA (YheA/YmcA/DUF963 family)